MAMTMTMQELRGRLLDSFESMFETTKMDQMMVDSCVKNITGALMEADFPTSVVKKIEKKCEIIINAPRATNKGQVIYKIVFEKLLRNLDRGKISFRQEKVETKIVMFMGLQGVEKTNMCLKYARYHLNKGYRPALVCADTFNTDELIRLKVAAKDEIPTVHGSASDPAEFVAAGIEEFKKDKHDLIIVDTNGGHEQYSTLFDEMRPLAESMKPYLVIYVIDSSIGQSAFDQVQAFKQSFTVGVVMATNLNGSSKACGAISAVAAAKCLIILVEPGEKSEGRKKTNKKAKSEEFELFDAKRFLRRLLGKQIPSSLSLDWWVRTFTIAPDTCAGNPWLLGDYTLREMYTSYKEKLESDGKNIFHVGLAKPNYEKMILYTRIMDSMTKEELDHSNVRYVGKERMLEIAEASKVDVEKVAGMMNEYMHKARAFKALDEGRPIKFRF